MQTTPALWSDVFAASHKVEYRFDINGVSYSGDEIKGTPVITKPLLDKPAIGRVCTASLKLTIYPKSADIPKAATVNAYCRLFTDSGIVTDWIPQGKFYISTRSGTNPLQLNCLDNMIKTGTTYLDKTRFTEWPVSMSNVVSEICALMGVELDSRTELQTRKDYVVSYPNDDTLISEILAMIGAAHGGNWIITETGKLRLVVFASPALSVAQNLGRAHMGYTARGRKQTVSCVALQDSAENEFVSGDDTGLTLIAKCDYATQSIAHALCAAGAVVTIENGGLSASSASVSDGALTSYGAEINAGAITLTAGDSILYGATYEPYTVSNAYINPALELGDTITVMDRTGTVHRIVVQSITMNCTIACTCLLSASVDGETEDEYPYVTLQELALSRAVRTDQTYFGNRITRSEGFISELVVGKTAKARLTANASVFSMQSYDNGNWVDRIYFDTATGKYVITGDVTVNGMITANDLAGNGTTIINGANIISGTITGDKITANVELSAPEITGGTITGGTITGGTFISEMVKNGQVVARLTASPSTLSLSSLKNGTWVDGIYFDAASMEYVITGNVNVTGMITNTDLAGNGTTTINGANIITGTVTGDQITANVELSAPQITGGKITGGTVIGGSVIGGMIYATGEGADGGAAYYIYDSYTNNTLGNLVGYLSYDSHGAGTSSEAKNRVLLTTVRVGNSATGTALKIQADGGLSLESGSNLIWVASKLNCRDKIIYAQYGTGEPSGTPENGELYFQIIEE